MAYRFKRGFAGLGSATPSPAVAAALSSASAQYGVPLPLLQAVAFSESSYNPSAVSSAGAVGLMQIMPANFSALGITNPTDPVQSANAGASYLAQLYAQYGDWTQALEAYNQGPASLAANGPYSATAAYASTILANAGITDGSTAADSSSTTGGGDSTLFDFSSLAVDSSGDLTPLAWVGVCVAVGAIVIWAAS